jgi:hypothetical protein
MPNAKKLIQHLSNVRVSALLHLSSGKAKHNEYMKMKKHERTSE